VVVYPIFYTSEDLKPHPVGVLVSKHYSYPTIEDLKCAILNLQWFNHFHIHQDSDVRIYQDSQDSDSHIHQDSWDSDIQTLD